MPARKAKVTKAKPSGDVVEVKKSLQEKMKKTKSKGQKSSSKVDTLCPIGHKATIFKEGNEVWECMLNQTNIQNNNNKYFLLQLLVDESTGKEFNGSFIKKFLEPAMFCHLAVLI